MMLKYSLLFAFSLLVSSCGTEYVSNDGGDSGSSGGSSSPSGGGNNTRDRAIAVTAGYSASHAISKDGEHWFKFAGTGETIIFETTGNVVDTYIDAEAENYFYPRWDDNSGEGYNALLSIDTNLGETYFICVSTRSNTSGMYTFVVR
jgi:hypothetical protein